MNAPRSIRTLLSGIGAAALALSVTLAHPPAAAQAATGPDFKAVFFFDRDRRPNESIEVWAIYDRTGPANGPARVTTVFNAELGVPTILDNAGFACAKRSTTGLFGPAWEVTCTRDTVADGGRASVIKFRVKAPAQTGDYGMITAIQSTLGADPDDSDNRDAAQVHVR